ncbi:hypothetical protein ACTA71_007216 [Dictyostelium dimigraforme]
MDYNLLSNLSNKKRGNEKEKEEKEEEKQEKEEKEENKKEENENSIDYSKPIKWNEINVDRLIYYSFEEIKFIANSIGIFKNGIRKQVLIDKIKSYIKMNNIEIIENKIKQDNSNNPFNKNTFNSLEIPTIGKDGEKELLFWKVFKNKVLFKTIMSHTHTFSNSHIQFDHLISVESMLNNDQINILKEKVRLNRYLAFFSRPEDDTLLDNQSDTSTTIWSQLFSKIQDDKQFYINLFKNYKNQIPIYSINNEHQYINEFKDIYEFNFENRFQYIVNQLVSSNCIVGLQVLIEENLFIPTFEGLLISIKLGRIEIIKLFLSSISKEEIENNLKHYLIYIPEYKDNNSLESIKYLLDLVKNNQQYFKVVINQAFGFMISKHGDSLGTLIEIIGFFDSFNYWEEFKRIAIKFKFIWHSKVSFDSNSIDSLMNQFKNKIQSIKSLFSKDQLESSVYHPINYQSKENEIISNLLTIHFILTRPSRCHFIEYFICYGGAEKFKANEDFQLKSKQYFNNQVPKHLLERIIFEHASYQTLLNCHSNKLIYVSDWSFFKFFDDDENNTLFNKCTNRESQIQFIDLLIQDIITSKDTQLNPIFILMLLVRNDDLELVKYFLSKVDKSLIIDDDDETHTSLHQQQRLDRYSIIKNIKSIEMFEYIFNQFDDFTFSNELVDLNYFKHLEKLAIEKNLVLLDKVSFSQISIKPTVSFIKYVLERPGMYYIPSILKLKPIDYNENKEEYIKCLIKAFEMDPRFIVGRLFNFNEIKRNSTLHPSKNHCNLFKTIKEHSPNYFYDYFDPSDEILFNYYFGGGGGCNMENDKLFKDDCEIKMKELFRYSQVIEFSIIRMDLKILDRVLTIAEKEYSKGNKDDQYLIKYIIFYIILKYVVCEQQIFTLEYLFSNHNHIFKNKVDSKSTTIDNNFRNGIFTQSELRELLFLSLKGNNTKITDFLFPIITITKKQFQANSCQLIYQHYKDKFK